MKTIRILHVEDSQRDAELVQRVVSAGGFSIESTRVDNALKMAEALESQSWDVVLADCNMPNFDGFGALKELHANGQDIPMIVVSGTVRDETAVALMKAGVADYVKKDDLTRLVPAILREVTDAGHRRARRLAEGQLVERERMLSTAQRIAHLGSWERDFIAGSLFWSEELYTILGRPLDYQPSSAGSYADVAHPDDRDRVSEALASALEHGEVAALEHRIRRPDGEIRWVFTRMEPELNEAGEPVRLFGTVLDITERKHTEDEIRFQAHLLDTVEQAIVATDVEGRIVYWNSFAETLYGWSVDEALGQLALDIMLTGESDEQGLEIYSRLERGETWTGEVHVHHRDGKWFWAHSSISQIHDASGSLIGFVGLSFDVTERRKAADALRESEEKYRTLLEQAADGIVVADADRRIITVNSRACEMFGYGVDEFIGRDLFHFFHPEEIDGSSPIPAVQSGSTIINERSLRRKDNTFVPTETSTKQLEDGRIQVIIRDITERKLAEEALRRSEREYRNLFESANDAIILFDAESEDIIDLNRRAIDIFGSIGKAYAGGNLRDLVGDAPIDQLIRGVQEASEGVQGVEAVIQRPDGTRTNLIINASLVGFQGRQVVLSIHRDVTSQKELEHQLAHQALHDDLTGLANRTLFEDRVEHALARARIEDTDIAILMLDLDRFKLINETLGHDVGDRMLISVAERLRESLRDGDTVARLGGDEYTILLENVASMREVTLVAERISNVLQTPYVFNDHEVVVTASIGIVIGAGGRGTPEDLLRNADVAMYRAKDAGRRRYVVFDPSMNATMLERLKLESDLRQAIAREELRVYFQPTVELDTDQIVGLEALVRWMHPTRGLISPIDFIPLAEETGLIRLVDQFVLNAACRQIALWRKQYPDQRPVVINVNLSAQGFQHPELVDDISRALTESGIDSHDVQLEITESVIMTDATATHSRLQQLKELGVRLAIDDFGTGYSSLSYLRRFPVDTLKIDKSFIDGLGSDPEDTAIVEAVISLSDALGLNVVAEGIESDSAVRQLRTLGCHLGQGYHYSRPLPAEAFDELWANGLTVHAGWKAGQGE